MILLNLSNNLLLDMHLCFVLQDEQYTQECDITIFRLVIIEASPVSKAEKRTVSVLRILCGSCLYQASYSSLPFTLRAPSFPDHNIVMKIFWRAVVRMQKDTCIYVICTLTAMYTDTLEPGMYRRHHVDAQWGTLAPSPSFSIIHSLSILCPAPFAGLFPQIPFTFSAHPISWKSLDFLSSHSWPQNFPIHPPSSPETNFPWLHRLFLQSLAHLSL